MNNINVKTITVRKTQPLLNGFWLAIASVLRTLNAGYDDYDIRLHMGELTADEARAEIVSDIANHKKNMDDCIFWSGG